MDVKILVFAFFFIAGVSANGCCRNMKILQFRRSSLLPMCEPPPPCDGNYQVQDQDCDNSLYPGDPGPKYDTLVNHFYPPYMKPVTQKCVCGKAIASPRFPSRYYKRNYYDDPVLESLGLRPNHYPYINYGEIGQFGQCNPCASCNPCGPYNHCSMVPPPFRPPPHRVHPLTLPASCIC